MRTFTVWITGVSDGRDHAVTDEEMSAGMARDAGRYQALCGEHVLVASLLARAAGAALFRLPGRAHPGPGPNVRPGVWRRRKRRRARVVPRRDGLL